MRVGRLYLRCKPRQLRDEGVRPNRTPRAYSGYASMKTTAERGGIVSVPVVCLSVLTLWRGTPKCSHREASVFTEMAEFFQVHHDDSALSILCNERRCSGRRRRPQL